MVVAVVGVGGAVCGAGADTTEVVGGVVEEAKLSVAAGVAVAVVLVGADAAIQVEAV